MGFIAKKVGDTFAINLIKNNSGKSVRIIDKGVCDVTDSNLRGVFAHTNEGYFWVAKADSENPFGWCIEIDPTSVSDAFEHPSRCFRVSFRSWLPTNLGGINTGGFQAGEWTSYITLAAMTPNILEILQSLKKS